MSIATEITRLQKAKADIKTAIESKGVDAGDGLIDTYAGKIAEISSGDGDYYNTVWDSIQQNGQRTNYSSGFAGASWNDITFKPKYDISPKIAPNMFVDTEITDLKGLLENIGITLDFSKCTSFTYTFQRAKITHLGVIDTTSASNLNYIFHTASDLISIDKLILKANGSQSFTDTYSFGGCINLTDIKEIEGKFGNSISFKDSPLSVDTMKNIINVLEDFSDPAYAGAMTVTFSSSCWKSLEASGAAPDGYETWKDYVETGKGWAIG